MIKTTTIGSKEEPYPMITDVWDLFSQKGTKTVFVSIDSGKSCLPDLDFAETIGCPILKLVTTDEDMQRWTEVKDILKTRKMTETSSDFAKVASRKWILPKNLLLQKCLPSLHNGFLETEKGQLQTRKWIDILQEHCKSMGLPEEEVRLDILKVDSSVYDTEVLHSLWQTGFRPTLLLIHWRESPDSNLGTLLTAGHLQMIGYTLAAKEGNRFLYYYTDTNYYETCSWETPARKFENPFVANLVKAVYPGTENTNIIHVPAIKKE
jgi:hypothetical protein